MTIRIELREAKSGFNCVCCSERVRTCEKFHIVIDSATDSPVRGERYCTHCYEYAVCNNEDQGFELPYEDDGESGLRMRETYAAYQAAGCTKEFWTDQDILNQEREYIRRRGL